MAPRKSILLAAALCLLGTAFAAEAQAQYPAFPNPYGSAPATPPSWSYNPYTSGLAPCPQWSPGDLGSCRDQMPPTYGQPNYRSH